MPGATQGGASWQSTADALSNAHNSRLVLATGGAGMNGTTLDIDVSGLLNTSLTDLWVLFCAYLVFFQQCGFALLEAGSVRQKNTRNILLKNVIDACIAVVMWWAVGAAFQGVSTCGSNSFIGTTGFFLANDVANSGPSYLSRWLFGWAFCATASTIVSGAVAERTQFRSYVAYTFVITGIVYPVAAHWVWSADGWLSPFRVDCATGESLLTFPNSVGLIDFSGSGVVHVLGGTAALMGAWIAGPRIGRFNADGVVCNMPMCNPAQAALGTFILWLGWFGFNPGSTQCFYGCMELASRIAVNTTLGAGAGGLATLCLTVLLGHPGDIGPMLNGILAGLASSTGSCAVIDSWAAVVVGLVGGILYTLFSRMLKKLRIDDPLDASAVHGCCGAWGLIAGGLFATKHGVQQAYQHSADWGIFYGGSGYQLGIQLLGLVSIAAWSACIIGTLFFVLKRMGWLRASKEDEVQGLDYAQGIGSGITFWSLCFPGTATSDSPHASS